MLQDFEPPSGDIKSAIEKDFGSVEELSKKFSAKAATVQVWLNHFFECLKTSLLTSSIDIFFWAGFRLGLARIQPRAEATCHNNHCQSRSSFHAGILVCFFIAQRAKTACLGMCDCSWALGN